MTDTPEIPQFEQTTVTVTCQDGPRTVPAVVHPDCPGLAVTMSNFGDFTVTHLNSGARMCDPYERFGSAMAVMTEYQLIAHRHGFSWAKIHLQSEAAIKMGEIGAEPVPFGGTRVADCNGSRPMTIREWLNFLRQHSIGGEFPWEQRGPMDIAADNLVTLQNH